LKTSTRTAPASPPVSSAAKADAAKVAALRELCNERLLLVRDFTNQPENRDAISAVLEENRLAQKLVRRSPAVIARSAKLAQKN
jgi:hypothetical protein